MKKVILKTLPEIKQAVDEGKAVYAGAESYVVKKGFAGEYLIVCTINGYTIGLHGKENTPYANILNGAKFYTKE